MNSCLFEKKMRGLRAIYDWYEGIVQSFGPWACECGCATCCTSSLVLTTLEAANLCERNPELIESLTGTFPEGGSLEPLTITTNERAALCLAKQDIGEEAEMISGDPCPLLRDNRCLCYGDRPLMCRMMNSKVRCGETGHAEMSERVLTLNTVSLQVVEHLDRSGWSGYLIHLLPYFRKADFVTQYISSAHIEDKSLRRNQANPGYIVPPEDREQVRVWLADLNRRLRG